MRSILISIVLMLSSAWVWAHPGHDHAAATAPLNHFVLYTAIAATIVVTGLAIKIISKKQDK